MATVQIQDERRRFSRIGFHRSADLVLGHVRTGCTLLDVSLRGALVSVPPGFAGSVGDRCALLIQLGAGDALIQMEGVLAHREERSVGFHCTGIDLDSIVHLRRLVELNLGDDALLRRELGALVGGP